MEKSADEVSGAPQSEPPRIPSVSSLHGSDGEALVAGSDSVQPPGSDWDLGKQHAYMPSFPGTPSPFFILIIDRFRSKT